MNESAFKGLRVAAVEVHGLSGTQTRPSFPGLRNLQHPSLIIFWFLYLIDPGGKPSSSLTHL